MKHLVVEHTIGTIYNCKGEYNMPTILKVKGYRFFFFSREELRQHIHIQCQKGEAKFWLDPQIELAKNYKLSRKELNEIEKIIEEHYDEFIKAWEEHFGN
jgi:hypothetical protein